MIPTITTLEEVTEKVQYGYTTKAFPTGKTKFLRTTDITKDTLNWDDVPFCAEEPKNVEKYQIRKNDILISRAGSVGFSYLVKTPPDAVFASYLIRFRPKINPNYLYYFLQSDSYWHQISEKKMGIAVQNVNAKKLKSIHVPVFPTNYQQKIVEKIEELFTEIDSGVSKIKNLSDQIQDIKSAFLNQIFEAKKVPRVALKEVVEINPKFKLPDGETEASFLPMKSVEAKTGRFDLSETKLVQQVSKGYSRFQDNDILLAKITPCMENGKIALVRGLINGIGFGSTEFIVLRAGRQVLPEYLFVILNSKFFRYKAERNMTGAVGQRRVQKKFIEEYVIPIPDLEKQENLTNRLNGILRTCGNVDDLLNDIHRQQSSLKQSILAKAFKGELV